MIKTFTENDLIRFLYDELNEDERLDMKKSLCVDIKLQAKLDGLKKTKSTYEPLMMKASGEVVSKILYTSKNLLSA